MPRNVSEGLTCGYEGLAHARGKNAGENRWLISVVPQGSGHLVDCDAMRGWKEKESGFKNNNNNKLQAPYIPDWTNEVCFFGPEAVP